jgi:peptidoglycan hydrolase-like protein with peptidoglycan-binding domain
MEFAPPQPRRWVGVLVVTAAAALALGPEGAWAAQPLPEAGWHGRPIQHPKSTPPEPVPAAYGRGSAPVREVQRMLLRIGYAVGPVDGVFGVRTRSSVQWFQIKHGFQATGVVDHRTLTYLRFRSRGTTSAQPSGVRREILAQPARVAKPSPAPARPEPLPDDGVGLALFALLVVLGVSALSLPAIALRRRRRPAPAEPTQPAEPQPVAGPSSPPAPAETAKAAARDDLPRAIGYATGRDRDELERHAAAIQRACTEREWTLACLVRDGGGARRRPGLAFALDQISGKAAPRLVVARLDHLGRSVREVTALLEWCARDDVALVALDADLDTSTAEGRVAARRLIAAGTREAAPHGPRPPRRAHGRPNGRSAAAKRGLSSTSGSGG